MSTPRLSSWTRASSRAFSWNPPSSAGAISISRTGTRAGSTSGKVAGSTVPLSSARVPASSTPGAPPPATGRGRAPRSPARHGDVQVAAVHAQPLERRHEMIAQHDGVGPGVQAEGVLGRTLDAVIRGRHPGGDDEVVVAELQAVSERDRAGGLVDPGQVAMPEDRLV